MIILSILLVAVLPFTTALGRRVTPNYHRTRTVTSTHNSLLTRDIDPDLLYPAHNLSVPTDHFQNETLYAPHTNATFPLRYWFDASHYVPGGPVILLQGGETSGADRLPYLQKGLLAQLASATGGVAVVLEHRYYGTSMPMPDLSTESLRFLTTEQALADSAYFARNVVFPGLEDRDLTSNSTAWIGYGGSYAGAYNAFLRTEYPEVFWGTISSSGVTKAIWDYWEYWTPIAENAERGCVRAQKALVGVVDGVLIGKAGDEKLKAELQKAFGLGNVTHVKDFAAVLGEGISNWQNRNWDPEVGSPAFDWYCANLTSNTTLYPGTEGLLGVAEELITAGGYNASEDGLVTAMLNFMGYVNLTAVAVCAAEDAIQDQCFGTYNATFYAQDDLAQTWRSWSYQYCTEWGYLQTGSGTPADQRPLVSRLLDIEYESMICRLSFNITEPADTERINKYGGYNISYPRLAFIDGQADPWRPATPHAFAEGAPRRNSTASEPFILIEGAVHHWDENGLFANETTATLPPVPVKETQLQEVAFVLEWMEEWKQSQLVAAGVGTASASSSREQIPLLV